MLKKCGIQDTTKGNVGHGIGLAFCKDTMRALGGDIVAQSIKGRYMEFTLQFPKPGYA